MKPVENIWSTLLETLEDENDKKASAKGKKTETTPAKTVVNCKSTDDILDSLIKSSLSRQNKTSIEQYELPLGVNTVVNHENQRVLPSDLIQSALFGIVRPGKRKYIINETISSLESIEIQQTGEQLDQNDLDVWINVLYLVNQPQNKLSNTINITQYAFLKLLNLTNSGSNRKSVVSRLERLATTSLVIQHTNGSRYIGHLLNEVEINEVNKSINFSINPKIINLFRRTTFVDIADRHTLGNDQLSRWLHIFFLTHKNFHPYLITTVKSLSGSTQSDRHFKNALKKSIANVNVIRFKKNQKLIECRGLKIGLEGSMGALK